jgi:hypothetical protein
MIIPSPPLLYLTPDVASEAAPLLLPPCCISACFTAQTLKEEGVSPLQGILGLKILRSRRSLLCGSWPAWHCEIAGLCMDLWTRSVAPSHIGGMSNERREGFNLQSLPGKIHPSMERGCPRLLSRYDSSRQIPFKLLHTECVVGSSVTVLDRLMDMDCGRENREPQIDSY